MRQIKVMALLALLSILWPLGLGEGIVRSSEEVESPILHVPKDFPSIQETIDHAPPYSTILVDALGGPYEGLIIIHKALTIQSINGRAIVWAVIEEDDENIVTITASNVLWQGFQVKAQQEPPPPAQPFVIHGNIRIKHASHVTLRDNIAGFVRVESGRNIIIEGNYLKGTLKLVSVRNSTIIGNRIEHVWMGISLEDASGNKIIDNIVTINTRTHGLGLSIAHSHDNTLKGNKIQGAVWGINLWRSNSNQIIGNQVHNLTDPLHNLTEPRIGGNLPLGIRLYGGSSNVLSANEITDYGWVGVGIFSSEKNMVQVNAITDGEIAILGISAQENQVIENTISNSIIGIQLSDLSSDNLLQDNKIQQVIQGIILEDSWENMLKNNTIEEAEIAIWLKWASDNRLYKNMLTKNIQGIILKSADGNLLEGNMINNQAQSGIELLVSHENVIKDNELKANGIGIVIGADSMDNQVLENLIEGNHRVGLLLQGAVGNLVQNNQIWDQGEVGLQLTGSDENEVLSNQLQGNPKGIVIEHGWGNVVAGNVLSDHTTVGIELIESRQTQLVDNHLTARSQFEAIAIRLEQGKENILEGNEIIGHRQGIYLHQSLSNRFLDNEVQSASKEAICLSKSEDNLLLKNILRFSEAGVLLDQADTNTLKENDIHENKFGIILDRANENMLEKNQVTLNQVGIDLRQGQGNVIRANHVAENEFGILLNEMEINILEANTVERNTYGDVMILDFVPGELIVGFKEGVTQQEAEVLIRKLKMRVLKFFARFNIYHLCFPKPAQGCRLDVTAEETLRKVDEFNALHQVEFAEPNIRFELDLSWLPNDERYADQWYLAKIGINRAWEAGFTFSRGVVVAIADTGVDLGHPDLMENLIGGWDFVNNDPEPEDNIGHGTFATGLIGAVGDNGQGISGISWRASLLPLKVADREAWYEAIWRFFRRLFGKGDDFIEAMEWLLELKDNEVNIRVINFSARTTRDSEALRKVIKEVTGEDILFVTVSGNRLEGGWNTDQEGQGIYPCNYPIENLICVGASTEDDGLAGFSNYGPESVDLVAPGVGIISLVPRAGGLEVPMLQRGWSKRVDSLTGLSSGTSFSAALVSGVATLLFAVCPEKDAFEIKELILESTEQNGNLEDKISRGRLRWPKLAMLREEGCNVSPEL